MRFAAQQTHSTHDAPVAPAVFPALRATGPPLTPPPSRTPSQHDTHPLQPVPMPLPLPALIATLALLATPAPAAPLPLLVAPGLLPQRRERIKTGMFRWLVEDAPDDEWRVYFRVSRETYQYIVDTIAHLPCFRVRPQNMHNAVSVERQVAAFLFRAGGMSVLRTRNALDIGKHTICQCTQRVMAAILKVHGKEIYLPPNGSLEAARVSQQFYDKGFPGARGIIDCTHVPIVVATDVFRSGNRWAYVDKDGRVTKTYQVICDANLRILDVDGGQAGKSHDMTVLRDSGVYKNIEQYLDFAKKQFFMGDSGYTLRPWLQHGYTRPEVNEGQREEKEYYNRRYSGVRITIERAFGGKAVVCLARVHSCLIRPIIITLALNTAQLQF